MTLPVIHAGGDLTIVDPRTGEVLDPESATNEQIARWRRAVMDWEQMAREAKRAVDAVIIERMDSGAQWTLEAGDFKLTAPSPAPSVEWEDIEGLRSALRGCDLADEVIDRAFKPTIVFKPQASGIKALRSLHREDINSVLDTHGQETSKDRRVSVRTAR